MPNLLPVASISAPPTQWPGLLLWAATVYLEADAEPDQGKLAVAWVIKNRILQHGSDVHDVILAKWQFSCWNDDYDGMRRSRLIAPDPGQWEACWRVASGAHWGFLADPTFGANSYLNPVLTKQIRPLHDLPKWYDERLVTFKIGRHEFLRLA